MPNDGHIITWLGSPEGQCSWISENAEEVPGLKAECLEHRTTTCPLFPSASTCHDVLAQERKKKTPRLTLRSWPSVQLNGDAVPLSVIALFLRDDDGELENVFGAAWRCADQCPACSQMPRDAVALRRDILSLARAAASL